MDVARVVFSVACVEESMFVGRTVVNLRSEVSCRVQ